MDRRTSHLRTLPGVLVCASLAVGCVLARSPEVPDPPGALAYRAGVPAHLPASARTTSRSLPGSVDEAPDELTVLIRPRPPVEPVGPPGRAGGFGLRVGYLMVTRTEDSEWDPAVATGFFFRGERNVPFEIGMDYASLVGTLGGGETVESRMYHLRFDAIVRRNNAARRAPEFYLLAGAMGGLEDGTWNLTGDKFLGGGGGVNLGLGVASPRGLWDARAVYSVYASSEEVKGTLMTAVGVSF